MLAIERRCISAARAVIKREIGDVQLEVGIALGNVGPDTRDGLDGPSLVGKPALLRRHLPEPTLDGHELSDLQPRIAPRPEREPVFLARRDGMKAAPTDQVRHRGASVDGDRHLRRLQRPREVEEAQNAVIPQYTLEHQDVRIVDVQNVKRAPAERTLPACEFAIMLRIQLSSDVGFFS